jgi:hypothetical protein
MSSYDKPLIVERRDDPKALKQFVDSLFHDNDAVGLTVVLSNPKETSIATITAFVDKMSEAVDKKKVLRLSFVSK